MKIEKMNKVKNTLWIGAHSDDNFITCAMSKFLMENE